MKKRLRLFAMLFIVATVGLTTSCTKDDEDQIVGEWELTHFVWSYYVDEDYRTETDGNGGFSEGIIGARLILKEDGLYEISVHNEYASGNYVLRDEYLTFDRELFFWEKKFKIEKLTSKELTLSYSEESDHPDHMENTMKVWAEFKRK